MRFITTTAHCFYFLIPTYCILPLPLFEISSLPSFLSFFPLPFASFLPSFHYSFVLSFLTPLPLLSSIPLINQWPSIWNEQDTFYGAWSWSVTVQRTIRCLYGRSRGSSECAELFRIRPCSSAEQLGAGNVLSPRRVRTCVLCGVTSYA